jgi:hypothetical protein
LSRRFRPRKLRFLGQWSICLYLCQPLKSRPLMVSRHPQLLPPRYHYYCSLGISRPCTSVPEPGIPQSIPLDQYYDLMPSVTFNCPRDYVPIPGQAAGYVEQVPTILASVNFTKLSGFVTQRDSNYLLSPPLVQIMLGFTKKTKNILSSTSPVPLIPGMNVVGLSNVYIRQRFTKPALSAFGLFDVRVSISCEDTVS